jgi:hypothetical protein
MRDEPEPETEPEPEPEYDEPHDDPNSDPNNADNIGFERPARHRVHERSERRRVAACVRGGSWRSGVDAFVAIDAHDGRRAR